MTGPPFWKAISLFAYLIQVWMDWKEMCQGKRTVR